jgi:D-psicose/D-tagatose/L-ribulose 3-epimerase
MSYRFRHAICNEAFEKFPFREACRVIRKAGYEGIEIAPFTLAEDPATISDAARRELRDIMRSEGLAFVGLHWLMVGPKGLHVSTPDVAVRTRGWQRIHDLIDLCADLGDSGIMVFGSPQQRRTVEGDTRAEATRRFVEGLAGAAPHAGARGVTILAEALPVGQCDVVTTLEEAVSIVRDIGSPALRTMYDTHNGVDEIEPHERLIEKYFEFIRHVHVNEMDGRHPGPGGYDFKPVLATLRRLAYPGWVSLEAFDFTPGAEVLANQSLRYLEAETAKIE